MMKSLSQATPNNHRVYQTLLFACSKAARECVCEELTLGFARMEFDARKPRMDLLSFSVLPPAKRGHSRRSVELELECGDCISNIGLGCVE